MDTIVIFTAIMLIMMSPMGILWVVASDHKRIVDAESFRQLLLREDFEDTKQLLFGRLGWAEALEVDEENMLFKYKFEAEGVTLFSKQDEDGYALLTIDADNLSWQSTKQTKRSILQFHTYLHFRNFIKQLKAKDEH